MSIEVREHPLLVPLDGDFRIADIIIETLRRLNIDYPEPDAATRARFEELRKELEDAPD